MTGPFATIAIGGGGALASALGLGLLHGLTPDEHTWPITMSYALGGFSGRRGLHAALLFSAAFTAQRALASELAYFALAGLLMNAGFNAGVDLAVGLLMAVSGAYILHLGREPHLTESLERRLHRLLCRRGCREGHGVALVGAAAVPLRMTLVHGFVAGWGTGPFALVIYTVLAPAMGSPALAFLPGLLFGLGTMAMQGVFGAAVGAWMRARRLGGDALARLARVVSGAALAYGGLLFTVWGSFALALPGPARRVEQGIPTGIPLPGLDHLGAGLALVLAVLAIVAWAFRRGARPLTHRPSASPVLEQLPSPERLDRRAA
ncbi:MAG TPA: hypothetical protein VE995_02375 [Gaiellaceae bacterium]|nr:hypothetical protein [Gaiellaceae bacterium]